MKSINIVLLSICITFSGAEAADHLGSATTQTPQIGPLIEHENPVTHLICDVTPLGYSPATFSWTRAGSSISGGQSGTQTISANSATVSDHDAVWTCTPRNSLGTGEPAYINVIVNARATPSPALPTSHTAVAGNTASLSVTCGFTSKPAAAITWTYNGGSLRAGVRTESAIIFPSGKKWTVTQRLVWDSAAAESDRRNAGGSYVCHGQVALGAGQVDNKSSTMQLIVQYKPGSAITPTTHIGPLIEHENSVIHLICDVMYAAGNPQASFTWTRGGFSISGGEGGTQTISANSASVSDHDAVWTCTPQNSVGIGGSAHINVTINARATLTPALPTSHTAVAGNTSSLSVTCGFTSKPAAAITWTYNGGSLPTGVRTESPVKSPSGKKWTVTQRLVWDTATYESDRRDAGESYVCYGQVALGTGQVDCKSSTMQLIVQNVELLPLIIGLVVSSIGVAALIIGMILYVLCRKGIIPECEGRPNDCNDNDRGTPDSYNLASIGVSVVICEKSR